MTEVTQLLAQIDEGEPDAADLLLPLVYDELRRLAAIKTDRKDHVGLIVLPAFN